jgi:hypothetical protein
VGLTSATSCRLYALLGPQHTSQTVHAASSIAVQTTRTHALKAFRLTSELFRDCSILDVISHTREMPANAVRRASIIYTPCPAILLRLSASFLCFPRPHFRTESLSCGCLAGNLLGDDRGSANPIADGGGHHLQRYRRIGAGTA